MNVTSDGSALHVSVPVGDQHANLKGTVIRGASVTLLAQGAKVVLNVGSTMVLARLLTPSDFGLVAMVTAVTGFVEMFKDAGLSTATVQRENVSNEQLSTLFWLNVGVSAVLMVVIASLAPLLAHFYRQPKLTWLTVAIAAEFLLSGLTVQHLALLRRHMLFKAVAVIDIVSLTVGVSTGVTLAWLGFGYWALVAMNGAAAFTNAVAVWITSPWRPGRPHRFADVAAMVRFGTNIVGVRFIYSLASNAPSVLIGRWWGAGSVGLYQKAYGLLMFAIDQIHAPISAVALSPLSRVQSDPERFRRYFLAGYRIVVSGALPVVVTSAVFSEEIIRVLLGPQWMSTTTIFRLLALGAIFVTLLNPLGIALLAVGRADRQVKLTVLDTVLVISAYLVSVSHGVQAVALSFLIIRAVVYLPIASAMLDGTGISLRDVLTAARSPLVAAFGAALVGIMVKGFLGDSGNVLVRTVVGVGAMLSAYAGILLVVLGQWPFYRQIVREFVPLKPSATPA